MSNISSQIFETTPQEKSRFKKLALWEIGLFEFSFVLILLALIFFLINFLNIINLNAYSSYLSFLPKLPNYYTNKQPTDIGKDYLTNTLEKQFIPKALSFRQENSVYISEWKSNTTSFNEKVFIKGASIDKIQLNITTTPLITSESLKKPELLSYFLTNTYFTVAYNNLVGANQWMCKNDQSNITNCYTSIILHLHKVQEKHEIVVKIQDKHLTITSCLIPNPQKNSSTLSCIE